MADLPIEIPVSSVNRLCSSGLEAVSVIASKISSGIIECGLGCGVESMSLFDMNGTVDVDNLSDKVFEDEKISNCLIPMGMTSEILTEKFGLKRKNLDLFALNS